MNIILKPFRMLGLWSNPHNQQLPDNNMLTVQGTTYKCAYCAHQHLNGIKRHDWMCCAEAFNKYSIQSNTLHRELGKWKLFNEPGLLAIMEQFLKEEFISAADRALIKHIQSSDGFFDIDTKRYSNNKYVMLALVKDDPCYIEQASIRLRNDPEVVGAAVGRDGQLLECASDTIKNNREVVLKAVKQNGLALRYASAELKNDKAVVLEAVKQDGSSLQYASDALKNDRDVVLVAVKNSSTALSNASDEMRSNKDIAMVAVKAHGKAFQHVGDSLKNDKELAIEGVKQDRLLFYHSIMGNKILANDRDVILAALEKNWYLLQFVSKEFQNNNPDIIDAVIALHPDARNHDLRKQ